jgi:hypothetical protein
VSAVAEGVRGGREPTVGERRVLGEDEGLAQVRTHVIPDRECVDLVLRHAMKDAAGLLDALGRVLGEVAGDLTPDVTLVEPADVELAAPAHAAATQLVGQRRVDDVDGRTDGALQQLAAVYGLDMAEQLGVGLAFAALTRAVDDQAQVRDRGVQLTTGFLAGGSLAEREADGTALISATRDELRAALVASGEQPSQIAWDHSVLERFPIIRLSGDRFRVLSPRALVAWMTRGVHYRLPDAAGSGLHGSAARDSRGMYLTYTGALGEAYVRRLMTASLRNAEAAGAIRMHDEVEFFVGTDRMDGPDVTVDDCTDVILTEVYSGRMSRQARSDASSDALQEFVRRAVADKLIELAARTRNLLDGDLRYDGLDLSNVCRNWPVLVLAGDAITPTPLLWGHLRVTCADEFLPDARVQRAPCLRSRRPRAAAGTRRGGEAPSRATRRVL